MYQVTMYDGLEDKVGQVIHSHTTGELKLKSGTIKQGINSFDTFSFDYLPNSPLFNNIRTGVTLIKVLNTVTGRYEFEGRIVTPEEEMNSGVSLHAICESELGFLNDSDQDFYEFRGTPEELLHRILNYHNSAVESSKNFTLGRVEITDPNDYYYVFLDPEETSWEAIKRTLLDKYGGEIVMRKENGVRYLDYLKQQGHNTDVTIALDKNLKSYRRVADITKIYSRIKPLGHTLEPDEISEEDRENQVKYPRLTIESVNKGSKYLDSPELIKNIGVKIGTVKFDDITTAERLKSSGQSYLDRQKLVLVQYTIDALDLALIGKDFESFEVGNTYVLINQVMNINERLRVVGKTINILAPWNNTLEIGDKMKTANEIQLDLNRQVKYAVTLRQQLQTANQLFAGRLNTVSTLTGDLSSNYTNLTNVVLPDFEKRLKTIEVPPTPPTDGNGYSTNRVFPVDYTLEGINYFVRAGKSPGSIEYDMTYGMRDGVLHSGHDIGTNGDRNYTAHATTDGVVRKAEFMSGGIGNAVYVEHTADGYWSNYMHLKSISVSVGQTVKAGDVIGVIGGTGGDYAPHLHFELSPDGVFHSSGNTVNPQVYLGITGDNTTSLPRPV
ncbi:phage tail protein [Aerococcus urinaeequi]|uniref:Phage tail protein n=1 Tax=Aerococcus urinaeequi TaxID=51665 RepID=A0AAF0BIY2_9LACT|nr:phage tail spike protein [Aerococcus urinaeequi]WCG37050.1 phage tail protein [Aerococcus urinaeequi]